MVQSQFVINSCHSEEASTIVPHLAFCRASTSTMLVIGVDGGATKTQGVVLHCAGSDKKIVGRGSAGSSNRNSVSHTHHTCDFMIGCTSYVCSDVQECMASLDLLSRSAMMKHVDHFLPRSDHVFFCVSKASRSMIHTRTYDTTPYNKIQHTQIRICVPSIYVGVKNTE